MPPTFQLFLPQMRMSHDAITDRAIAAEAAGFEGIAFMDHLAPPLAEDQPMWEAMTIAAWALARTTTLNAGHLVLCDSFRHPAVLAREVTTLDHAAGGRFELGIGWGSVPTEFELFGVGSTAARDRVNRLSESLEIMQALWTGETVDYQGEFFTLKAARQAPVPTRPIPITIGGVGKRTLELVRKHASWWNVPINHLDKLDALRDQAGDARVSIQVMVAVVPSEADRGEVTALALRRFGRMQMGENLLIGTADELTEQFGRIHARGIDRFYTWFADFAPPDTLHRFAPVIRDLSFVR